ncbi:MAG TPA: type II toxin-antitoxin system RelE/ParE family toxin [Marisediminicola sp.]|nr:type II toxin-antitoxin system RelE/ParE family toxin [Marisediminicola sp.]
MVHLQYYPHGPADPEAAVLHRVELEGPEGVARRSVGGAGVLEITEDQDGDTYRAVYTVNFPQAIYVLHVFQKKSKRGIATPKRDLDLVRSRCDLARQHYQSLGEGEDRHA